MNEIKITPMLKQYLDLKEKYPEEVLMFRLGDFYEMFMEDAVKISKMLQLTLTKRGEIPMCGIPYHSSKHYFHKLIAMGKKIAVAEQFPDPENPSLMKRDVVEIITPSTYTEDDEGMNNNYLCSLYFPKPSSLEISLYFSAANALTGALEVSFENTKDVQSSIRQFLNLYEPKELILPPYWKEVLPEHFFANEPILVSLAPPYINSDQRAKDLVLEAYEIQNTRVLGLENIPQMFYSLAYLFYYLQNNYQQKLLTHLKYPSIIEESKRLKLDYNTLRNLEILQNNETKTSKNSLFEAVNETLTHMGGRLLKQYLTQPLRNVDKIKQRQNEVKKLIKNSPALREIRSILKEIHDFSRLFSKIALNKILPKEFITLRNSLSQALKLIPLVRSAELNFFQATKTEEIENVLEELKTTLLEEPNNQLSEGNFINEERDLNLKRLNRAKQEGKKWLIDLLDEEKAKTGVASMKIKYTSQSGYGFEITKQHLKNLPPRFILSKTMLNASRFVTEELLKLQEDIFESKEKAVVIENEIYRNLKETIKASLREIQNLCDEIAKLDVIQGFAQKALNRGYVCPSFTEDEKIEIVQGRHPVIEEKVEAYIPNDLFMTKESRLHILTGPNMAGKSTFLRQNALIFILAQAGSFVPAKEAKLPIIDKLFTRIGTSDNLSEGQSTFLVEMSESAYILNHASSKSFIIMDEIGRGTSTYDGMSIAHAILNYIVEKIGAFTLFATHYHELFHLNRQKNIKSYTMSIEKKGNELNFLHKVIEGFGSHSYGVHVAKLSGLPKELLKEAFETLKKIENSLLPKQRDQTKLFDYEDGTPQQKENQESIAFSENEKLIIEALRDFDVNTKSPMDALYFLDQIKRQLD